MNPPLEQEYLNKIKECKARAKQYYDSREMEDTSMLLDEVKRCT